MTNQDYLEEQTITLDAQDGKTYTCRILCVFEFENKEYALLQNVAEGESEKKDNDNDNESPVIMQLVQEDNQAVFKVIEDDQEFDKVVEYIKQLANEIQADESEEG